MYAQTPIFISETGIFDDDISDGSSNADQFVPGETTNYAEGGGSVTLSEAGTLSGQELVFTAVGYLRGGTIDDDDHFTFEVPEGFLMSNLEAEAVNGDFDLRVRDSENDDIVSDFIVSSNESNLITNGPAGVYKFRLKGNTSFIFGGDQYKLTITLSCDIQPEISCPQDITLQTGSSIGLQVPGNDIGECSAFASWTNPTETADICQESILTISINNGTPETVSQGAEFFTQLDEGEHTVTYVITDSDNNTDMCSFTVTVEDDKEPEPVCLDTSVEIQPNGQYELQKSDIYDANSSSDNCGIASVSFSPTTFSCDDVGLTFPIMVTAKDFSGNSSDCIANVTVKVGSALPDGWSTTDIGNVTLGNEYSFDPCTAPNPADGEFTITGSGNNGIVTTTDNVAFASQTLCGDGMITAKMESITPNGYAGLMIRETTAAGSKQTAIFSNLTNVLRHEARYSTNGSKQVQAHFRPFPFWLRLQRQGNWVFAYYSTTGSSFSYVHAVYMPMQNCVEIGLASFTYLPNAQTEAVFSHVSVTGGNPSLAHVPQETNIAQTQAHTDAQLKAFPNPTSGQVQLQFPQGLDTEATVSLRSLTGQTLQQRQLQPGDAMTDWDLSTQPAGVYFIEVRCKGLPVETLRVVKN